MLMLTAALSFGACISVHFVVTSGELHSAVMHLNCKNMQINSYYNCLCSMTDQHLQVRYLKVIEKSGYQALPWVRYITTGGEYEIRMA